MTGFQESFTPLTDEYLRRNGAKIIEKKILDGTVQYQVLWRPNGKRFTIWVPRELMKNSHLASSYESRARSEREKNRQICRKYQSRDTISLDVSKISVDSTPAKTSHVSRLPLKTPDCVNASVVNVDLITSTPQIKRCSTRVTRVLTTNKGRSSTSVVENDWYVYDYDDHEVPDDTEDVEPNTRDKNNESIGDPVDDKTSPVLKADSKKIKITPKALKFEDRDFNAKNPGGRKKIVNESPSAYTNFYLSQRISSPSSQERNESKCRRLSIPSVRPSTNSPSPFALQRTSNDLAALKKTGMAPLEITVDSEGDSWCLAKFSDYNRLLPKNLLQEHFPDEYEKLIIKCSPLKSYEEAGSSGFGTSSESSPLNQSTIESASSPSVSMTEESNCFDATCLSKEGTELDDTEEFELILSPRVSSAHTETCLS